MNARIDISVVFIEVFRNLKERDRFIHRIED